MLDIVLIGSSIFEFWGQPAWNKLKVENHAKRSTTSKHWKESDLSTLPQSRGYLIYCGSNDLILGQPEYIFKNVLSIVEQLHCHFPNSQLGYFSIIKCPQKAEQYQLIESINNSIKEIQHKHFEYFESNYYLTDEPISYLEDGLHLTDAAYQLLTSKLEYPLTIWLQKEL